MNRICKICGEEKSLEEFEKICNGHSKYCTDCGEFYIEDLLNNSKLKDNTYKYLSEYIKRFNYSSKKRIERDIKIHSWDKTETRIEKVTETELMLMLETFNYKCVFSNKKLQIKDFSLEHIDELYLSRNHSLYNLAPACRDINKIAASPQCISLWFPLEEFEIIARKYGKESFDEFYWNKNWVTSLWKQGIHEIPKEKSIIKEKKEEPKTVQEQKKEKTKEVQKLLRKPQLKKKRKFKWHTDY